MAITAFESGADIAFVGTVLPPAVSVGRKGSAAADAGVFIDRFSVDLIQMTVPPFPAAGLGAELDFLASGILGEWLSTVPAAICIRLSGIRCTGVPGENVPPAKGGYLILCQAQRVSDSGISITVITQFPDFSFLFVGHKKLPPVTFHWR